MSEDVKFGIYHYFEQNPARPFCLLTIFLRIQLKIYELLFTTKIRIKERKYIYYGSKAS